MELKSGEGTVVVADRDRCCNDGCNRNSGWGSGWGAVGGALVGGGFGAAAVSVWDKINDTKADIQKVEFTVQEAKAGIYKDISDAARGVTQEVNGVAKRCCRCWKRSYQQPFHYGKRTLRPWLQN